METPLSLLAAAAHDEPDRVAFAEPGRSLTYAEWNRAAARVAAGLSSLGVGAGDVVALMLPNGIAYPVCYLGALRAGCVVTGINTRYGSHETGHIVSSSGARLLIGTPPSGVGCPVTTVEALAAGGGDVPTEERAPGDPVAIVYTSGTTGLPKGAVYTAAAIDAVTRIELSLDPSPHPRGLGALPMPHMNFMTKIGYFIARRGTTVFTGGKWSARAALEAIERERLTAIGGIPTQVSLMLLDSTFARRDLSSLRSLTLGGAPCSPELVRQARERFGVPVYVRYSCTEVGLATGTRAGDPDDVVARTVGRPLPEVSVRVAAGGEVCVRSPAMMSGYWRDEAATAEAIDAGGYFHTGDLGVLNDDGTLTLNGRAREMYIRGGYNVYPIEVETAIAEHPGVALVAVVGVPDDVMGERGRALVVARDPANPPEDLREFLKGRIADYKIPDTIEFRDALPLTPMFKVDKERL